MRRILRYNKYETDPLAKGSPCNQLACRGDLMPSPLPDGAVNAKFTSSARLAKGEMLFVAGPTNDDQPTFVWSQAPALQQTVHCMLSTASLSVCCVPERELVSRSSVRRMLHAA